MAKGSGGGGRGGRGGGGGAASPATPKGNTRSPEFAAARSARDAAIAQARLTGSPNAVREAVRAQQRMTKLGTGKTQSYPDAERLVLQRIGRNAPGPFR